MLLAGLLLRLLLLLVLLLGLLVEHGRDLVHDLGERVGLGLDLRRIVRLLGLAQGFHALVDPLLLVGGDLVAGVGQRLLRRVQQRVGLVH